MKEHVFVCSMFDNLLHCLSDVKPAGYHCSTYSSLASASLALLSCFLLYLRLQMSAIFGLESDKIKYYISTQYGSLKLFPKIADS
jgi:hypothetical protein